MELTGRGDAGHQQGGQVPGKKGRRNNRKKAWLPEASPHVMLHALHTTQLPLSESLSCALSRTQEVVSFLAPNLDLAISAGVSQEQAASSGVPRERQEVLATSSHVSFVSPSLFYYLYYFNSFLLGSPAFPCETSSEIPLLELITLSWQLEFSKFNSPLHLPSTNSPFPIPISCHMYVFLKK